jgi:hypothetical protein
MARIASVSAFWRKSRGGDGLALGSLVDRCLKEPLGLHFAPCGRFSQPDTSRQVPRQLLVARVLQ